LKNTAPTYSETAKWAKLITLTGGAQAIIQVVGLISGIIIIRFVSTREYAFYTIANTILGTMVVLADGGIGLAAMAKGGETWQDREKLGVVIASAIALRRKFAVISLVIALPTLLYLLTHQGANWLEGSLIALALVPAFLAALSDTLLEIAPKLKQDIKALQRNQLTVNILRLFFSLLTVLLFPYAYLIILAAGVPRTWGNFKLSKISALYADPTQKPDKLVQHEILASIRRMLPASIYYCISGQITIWLLSLFGSTNALARIGGLSRLAAVLTVFSLVAGILFEPRFARLVNNRKLVIRRFLQIQGIVTLVGLFILLLIWIFPNQITAVLGKGYSGLKSEVLLVYCTSYLAFLSGTVYRLSAGRGIVPSPTFFLTSIVLCQLLLFIVLDFKNINGMLLIGLFTSLFSYLFRMFYFFKWFFFNAKDNNINAYL
jgi:hypothetical protein